MDGVQVRRHVIGHGRVAEIVLARPSVLNALNTVMLVRFAQMCAELGAGRRGAAVAADGDRGPGRSVSGPHLKERSR